MKLVLASGSPRREALLRAGGFDIEIRPSGAEEWPYPGGDVGAYTEALARAKVAAVTGELVVGADTVVTLDGAVLGKPADADAAAATLRKLSGRTHRVVTGVAVRRDGRVQSAHATTQVTFRDLTDEEIEAYVATGEPLDKAGAYAHQGGAGAFVTAMEGDSDTVVGLPLRTLRELLAQL